MGDAPEIRTIGFVGLGNMGAPMASRLAQAGYHVVGYDVQESARARVVESGVVAGSVLADAARDSDAVILMLPNSAVVTAVLADDDFAEALAPDAIVIDMSSSDPLRTRELASRLAQRGIRMIDAPVSGGVKGAMAGRLTLMVGGDSEDLARATPVLDVLGRPIHAGPVGAGHAVKALNNLLSATHLWATSEAMVTGMRFGIDPQVMLEIFNGSSGRSGSTENKWPNFILTESYDSGFGLRLMLKDMRIAVDLAEASGAPATLGSDAVELWACAADELPADADHTEVARWIRARP